MSEGNNFVVESNLKVTPFVLTTRSTNLGGSTQFS